jgi:hypothetical protein
MVKLVAALMLASFACGVQVAEAGCANRAEQKEVDKLNKVLLKIEKDLVKGKQKCDKIEKKGLASCERKCRRKADCSVAMCQAKQEWYSGGRVGCYMDQNKGRQLEIAQTKMKMSFLIEKGCKPMIDGGKAYNSVAPIDLNAKNDQ